MVLLELLQRKSLQKGSSAKAANFCLDIRREARLSDRRSRQSEEGLTAAGDVGGLGAACDASDSSSLLAPLFSSRDVKLGAACGVSGSSSPPPPLVLLTNSIPSSGAFAAPSRCPLCTRGPELTIVLRRTLSHFGVVWFNPAVCWPQSNPLIAIVLTDFLDPASPFAELLRARLTVRSIPNDSRLCVRITKTIMGNVVEV